MTPVDRPDTSREAVEQLIAKHGPVGARGDVASPTCAKGEHGWCSNRSPAESHCGCACHLQKFIEGLHGRTQATLQALLAERSTLQGEVATLKATIRIMDLSTPLEDELSDRIAEMLKYLAMGDGFTVSGVARLFVDCQRRMAVDWQEITRLRHYPVQSPPPVSPDGPHGAER